jgi:hypothetical protein
MRFVATFRGGDQRTTLRALRLATSKLGDGASREHVMGQLEALHSALRSTGTQEDEDIVLEVMDFVSG